MIFYGGHNATSVPENKICTELNHILVKTLKIGSDQSRCVHVNLHSILSEIEIRPIIILKPLKPQT